MQNYEEKKSQNNKLIVIRTINFTKFKLKNR